MRERELVKTLAGRLQDEALPTLQVRYGNQRGPDIEGLLPRTRRRLFIEAKGVRRRGSERRALGEALLQILEYYDEDVVCAIAVPYTADYEEVLRSILPGLRRLGVPLLLVRPGEVWYIGPHMKGFFPEKLASVTERLDT